jgi:hypothetical protein
MAGRAAAVILALMVLALTVLGVDYVLDYLGTDIVLNFYPWDRCVRLRRGGLAHHARGPHRGAPRDGE